MPKMKCDGCLCSNHEISRKIMHRKPIINNSTVIWNTVQPRITLLTTPRASLFTPLLAQTVLSLFQTNPRPTGPTTVKSNHNQSALQQSVRHVGQRNKRKLTHRTAKIVPGILQASGAFSALLSSEQGLCPSIRLHQKRDGEPTADEC